MFKTIFLIFSIISFSLESKELKIKIISTTDIHGAIFPFDFIENKKNDTSLFHINSFVKAEREKKNQRVILLDNGDLLQGQPIIYYYNFISTMEPHIISRIMNYMKYDLAVIGNHDIETGPIIYNKIRKEFNFPWLGANAINIKTNKPYFTPYKIFLVGGIKIAFLGLVTPTLTQHMPEEKYSGLKFENLKESSKKWVSFLQKEEKPDIIIGSFHEGMESYHLKLTQNDLKESNSSLGVAHNVDGFDIIFTGHDHENRNFIHENLFKNKVLILGARNNSQFISCATIDLTFDENTKKWEKNVKGELIEVKNLEPDIEMQKKFLPAFDEVHSYLNTQIGENIAPMIAREALFNSAAFIDLIHKVQLETTKADLSFTAPLSIDYNVKKGHLYIRDLFAIYKFENTLYTMSLTGNEIKNYLEYSVDLWFNEMKNEDDHLLKLDLKTINPKYNFLRLKNRFFNFDSASGIKYTIDVSKKKGNRINIISFTNGAPFNPKKNYKVAINSYRASGGGGHLIHGARIKKSNLKKRILFSTQNDVRHYIMNYIKNKKTILVKPENNWHVIPVEWWKKGKEKDYKILFTNK